MNTSLPRRAWSAAWLGPIAATAILVLGGCRTEAERYLKVDGAHLERGEGVALTAGGAAQIGHSVLVAGTVTNTHPSKTAMNIHLEVRLFRNAGDKKPARIYDEYSIKGIEHVAPGQTASFQHYVKTSLGGYDKCEVVPTKADFP